MTISLNPFQAAEHQPFLWRGDHSGAALLVHGFPGTPAEMRPAAQVLHEAGWTVQGLLLPGFGPQLSELTHYNQADWAQAVRSALVALQAEYKTVVLVGNSIGAALALEVAAQQPPAGLILFAPFWCSANRWLDRIFPVARLFMHQLHPFQKANFGDTQFRAGIQRMLPEIDLDDTEIQAAIRSLALPLEVLGHVRRAGQLGYLATPQVRAPVLILQGHQDIVAAPRFTRQLGRRLPMLAGYVEVEGDHELSRAKTEAWPLVAAFMQRFAANLDLSHEAKL
ncbi:alpha/beta fold hydrolase [soil metagenome]